MSKIKTSQINNSIEQQYFWYDMLFFVYCFPMTYLSTHMHLSPNIQHFLYQKTHSPHVFTQCCNRNASQVVCILCGTISFSFKKAAIKMTAYFKIHGVLRIGEYSTRLFMYILTVYMHIHIQICACISPLTLYHKHSQQCKGLAICRIIENLLHLSCNTCDFFFQFYFD